MKIIDAHLHLFPPEPRTDAMAEAVGHQNSTEHLRKVYGELGMVHGVVMGNRTLETGRHCYPEDLFHYCVGLDSLVLDRGRSIPEDLPDQVEEHLKRENCCGVKLYPGYNRIWLSDPVYEPVYRLAERYDKPVAVHMGLTAHPRAHLKYSHPLALDEAAADFPERDDLPADTHAQLGPCFLQALHLPAHPLLIDVFTLGLHQPAGHEFGVVIEDPANVRLGLLP